MAKVENDKIINLEPNCLKKVKGKTMTLKDKIINIIEAVGWSDTRADKIIDLFLSIKCDRCGEILTELGGLAFSPPLDNKHTKTHICQKCWKLFEVWKKEKP